MADYLSYKILVIDDSPGNIEIIFNILRDNKYKTLVATSGKEGFKIALETQPSLIITDWDMPDFDGIETIKLFKSEPSTSNIPIIMATGKMTSSEDLQTALEAGAMDYVRKPIDKIELLARVRSAILLIREMNKTIRLEKIIAEKEKKELLQKLEQSKTELTKAATRLVHSSNTICEINDKITGITTKLDDKHKLEINKFITHIKANSATINWREFETIFAEVHGDFLVRLKNEFPGISKNEQKLCVLLKLNMTTKDISAITFQSLQAIEKARYRLRKKLKLGSDENLNLFLQQL